MGFIRAVELNKRFSMEGIFYRLDVGGVDYVCRGLAKIARKDEASEEADALFVMVNPGSCKPTDEFFVYPSYQEKLFEIPYVKAKQDPTQYQLMRLMERMKWNRVYIINLSDLRAGNLTDYRKLRGTFRRAGRGEHSIFSEERRNSIHNLVADRTRVIAAWGKNEFIREDAIKAQGYLSSFYDIEGLPDKEFPYYRHPFPMLKERCIQWLDDMSDALKGKVEA